MRLTGKEKEVPLVSIFTPTYNRAYTLGRLYESLIIQQQPHDSVEWVIVDDGSTDGTADLVKQWGADSKAPFKIFYIYQENQGKHVAWNTALDNVSGELFFPIDSDDYLVSNALRQVKVMYQKSNKQQNLMGFSGVRVFPGGDFSGGKLNDSTINYIDYSPTDRLSKGISGDLAEVFFTERIKRYPFPVYRDEKFVPEAVVYNRFSNDGYRIRGFGIPLYHCEYLEDGYTKNVNSLLIRNWKGYSLYIRELMHCSSSLVSKMMPLGGYCYRYLLKCLHLYK